MQPCVIPCMFLLQADVQIITLLRGRSLCLNALKTRIEIFLKIAPHWSRIGQTRASAAQKNSRMQWNVTSPDLKSLLSRKKWRYWKMLGSVSPFSILKRLSTIRHQWLAMCMLSGILSLQT